MRKQNWIVYYFVNTFQWKSLHQVQGGNFWIISLCKFSDVWSIYLKSRKKRGQMACCIFRLKKNNNKNLKKEGEGIPNVNLTV